MNKPKVKLDSPSRRRRAMTAKGLAAGDNRVDPTGGKYGAGIIRGFAVITRGEALGHGVWIDSAFVRQTRIAMNAGKRSFKSRFTHPGLSSDGMGKLLGRAYRGKSDGDILRSDLHVVRAAHRAPDGNLAQYVMDLANEAPESFGSSIVFDPDHEAELQFFTENGGKVDKYGYWDASEFRSPDPLNEKNLPHARLKALYAVDIVDDPAANPSGIFGRDAIFGEAEQLMLHAAGLGAPPQSLSLGVEPQRLKYFFTNFLERHKLQFVKVGEPPMKTTAGDTTATSEKTFKAEDLTKFRSAFGEQGVDWLLAGKSFEECEKLHSQSNITSLSGKVDALTAEIEQLKKTHAAELAAAHKVRDEAVERVKSLNLGGEKPVEFQTADEPTKKTDPKFEHLGDVRAKLASAIKLPGKQ